MRSPPARNQLAVLLAFTSQQNRPQDAGLQAACRRNMLPYEAAASGGNGLTLEMTTTRLLCAMYPFTKFRKMRFAMTHSTSSMSISTPCHASARWNLPAPRACVPKLSGIAVWDASARSRWQKCWPPDLQWDGVQALQQCGGLEARSNANTIE